jgi:DNA polymerase-3 subunit gamma/tau
VPPAAAAKPAAPPASSAAAAIPAAAPEAARISANGGDWHGLLGSIKLGGMVRELAHHCELAELSEGIVRLRLNPAHKSLLINKAPQEKLQAELSAHLGRPVKLSIEIGELAGETPAQRASNARAEKQNRAIAALEQDAFVRDMIDTFDATINEQSIKPL